MMTPDWSKKEENLGIGKIIRVFFDEAYKVQFIHDLTWITL